LGKLLPLLAALAVFLLVFYPANGPAVQGVPRATNTPELVPTTEPALPGEAYPAPEDDAAKGAPVPAVVFAWPNTVTWRGPGLLVVLTGGQPYVLDGPALDDSPRVWQLGGDVRAAPYAGMVLAVVDAEYQVLASVTISPPPTPTASPTPTPAVVPRRYLPVLLKHAALP
jgi:hypothetical protein